MHYSTSMLPLRMLLVCAGVLCSASIISAQTVRVLFFTGSVTSGGSSVRIGQQLSPSAEVSVGSGATLQLSINGKVMRYDRPGRVKVADAVRRAGRGENSAVANTVRTLAAASGADRAGRTSQAGATRLDGDSSQAGRWVSVGVEAGRNAMNDELKSRTGLENPLSYVDAAVKEIYGEDDMVVLEPRASAVPAGPVLFRWLRSPTANGYVVIVRNHVGDEIYRTETRDTTVTWSTATLEPGVYYSWELEDKGNALHNARAMFSRLTEADDHKLTADVAAVKQELGENNPALPLVMGGVYAEHRCYGQATRSFQQGATATPEHARELNGRALDVYEYDMYLSPREMLLLLGAKR